MKGATFATILAVVAIAISAALAAGPMAAPPCRELGGTAAVSASLDEVNPGTARFFCYRSHGGREVRFVIARASDGTVHSVFDACRQCYRFHKGYALDAGYLVCRLCGNRYRLDQIDAGKASCQPVHLENSRRGRSVEMTVAALEKGAQLF